MMTPHEQFPSSCWCARAKEGHANHIEHPVALACASAQSRGEGPCARDSRATSRDIAATKEKARGLTPSPSRSSPARYEDLPLSPRLDPPEQAREGRGGARQGTQQGSRAGEQGSSAGQQVKFNLQTAAEGRTFVKNMLAF